MEYGRFVEVTLTVLLSIIGGTFGQSVPDNPCPDRFQYEQDSSGSWYGIISVPNPYPYLAIDITVSIYVTAPVPSDRNAKLELVDKNAWQNLAAGNSGPVKYRLDFPLPSPLPTIKDIVVNGEVICKGTKPSALYLSTLTIQHAIFNNKCSSSNLQCPFNIQQSGGIRHDSPPPVFKPPPKEEIGLITRYVRTGAPYSPCADIFSYERDNDGNWYGLIKIPNPFPVVAIDLKVEIYLTEFVPQGKKGGLDLVNDLRDEWRRMRTGEQYSVPYKLVFPLQYPLPTLKKITANKQILCSGDKPESFRLTTLSFQHGIFHEKCSSSSLDCPFNTVDTPFNPVPTPFKPVQTPATLPPTHRPQTPPPTPRPPPPTPRPRPPTPRPPPPDTPRPQPPSESTCGNPVVRTNPLVVFGQQTSRGQWPWHAALYQLQRYDMRYICGGSFIGTRSIITAAHCVTMADGKAQDPSIYTVYLGRYDLRKRKEDGTQELEVSEIFVNPKYNNTKFEGDVAILLLSSTVTVTDFVRPVCLWNQLEISLSNIVKREGVVVGWGLDENSNTAEQLKMVKMPIVDQQTCIWSYPTFFAQFTSSTTFCAGYRNGSSVCNGDSGGGLVLPETQRDGTLIWMLRGIVSNSKPRDSAVKLCDTKNFIIFTDAAQYLDWITTIVI